MWGRATVTLAPLGTIHSTTGLRQRSAGFVLLLTHSQSMSDQLKAAPRLFVKSVIPKQIRFCSFIQSVCFPVLSWERLVSDITRNWLKFNDTMSELLSDNFQKWLTFLHLQ